ncbi:SDR family oxidoreductase [Wenyingzhuangia sp. chi5]|uniref:SDR family oxidoreductase n=1 Tax=Wenyingzhuangia gilva TaxID=3057677 RepID=A0ABT8VSA9_9FLAO|nr:SDR family oxidoreductase [Wenyingzhuangia sp. chi5]MDO3694842.1 SDR family oxidoreductase [Wenyingzhuangia sp. chi5]
MSEDSKLNSVNDKEVKQCIHTLESLLNDTNQLFEMPEDQRVTLMKVAGLLSRPTKEEQDRRRKDAKKAAKRKQREREKHARKETGIRSAREAAVFEAPKMLTFTEVKKEDTPELESPRNCYVCKAFFTKLHHFYDSMCTECGDYNYAKRFQTADLTGQVAIMTGSRLKIGYHITLMMLRAGATVVATTRFPADSAIRFAKEADFHEWGHRLKIHGLDLRHIPSVEIFCNYIEQKYDRLDILINNAAQTVRRPAGFYKHMMENEEKPLSALPVNAQELLSDHYSCLEELNLLSSSVVATKKNAPVSWHGEQPGVGLRASAKLSQIPYSFDNSLVVNEVFPEGELDADLQQVDLRKTNSWRLKIGEIETTEMLEVQLVNSVAPFVLINRLGELMKKENTGKKHIINVSAMEGKFYRFKKEDRHPHTNMAKAALNMLTHTSASTFAKHGIYMNAVDTGWVTDEDPVELSKKKVDLHDFQPPLDIVDGAARVIDPLFDGINTGKHWCGKFLKDYKPIDW